MGSLCAATCWNEVQRCEVDVQMVIGRLVMQKNPQLRFWKTILLTDGYLIFKK